MGETYAGDDLNVKYLTGKGKHHFNGRLWQKRRIIWTREELCILKVEQEILIDLIPLAEAKSVKAMNEADTDRTETFGDRIRKRGDSSPSPDVLHRIDALHGQDKQ